MIEKGDEAERDRAAAEAAKTKAAIDKAHEDLAKLRGYSDDISKNLNEFDNRGNLLSADVRKANVKKAAAAATAALALTVKSPDDAANKEAVLLHDAISKRLAGSTIKRLAVLPEAIEGVHDQIQHSLDQHKFELKAEIKLAEIVGHTPLKDGNLDPEELAAGKKAFGERLAKLQKDREELDSIRQAEATYHNQAKRLTDESAYTGSLPLKGNSFTNGVDSLLGNRGKSGGRYEQYQEFNRIRASQTARVRQRAHPRSNRRNRQAI